MGARGDSSVPLEQSPSTHTMAQQQCPRQSPFFLICLHPAGIPSLVLPSLPSSLLSLLTGSMTSCLGHRCHQLLQHSAGQGLCPAGRTDRPSSMTDPKQQPPQRIRGHHKVRQAVKGKIPPQPILPGLLHVMEEVLEGIEPQQGRQRAGSALRPSSPPLQSQGPSQQRQVLFHLHTLGLSCLKKS